MGIKQFLILSFLFIFLTPTAHAQDSGNSANQSDSQSTSKPAPSLEHEFLKNILRDQRVIWTSPFSIHSGDAKWIIPFAGSAALLFATDRRTAGELEEPGNHHTRLRISRDISQGGSIYTTGAIAGAFYLAGRATRNERARETGLLSLEALIDSNVVTTVLKTASQRSRPTVDDASGEFFEGGSSFPSGHSTSAWSVATIIASEYGPHRPLVSIAAYGLATAVSLSRFTGQNHFLSDVLFGSAIGYGVGRYVYHAHHNPGLDGVQPKRSTLKSKLVPFTTPIYSGATHTYGVAMSWQP